MRNGHLAMWGSNLLESAHHVAHAMHDELDVKRHALAIALSSLATGLLALDACTFSLGNWNTPWGCPDAGPAPPNATTTTSEAGCSSWSCEPGYFACGNSAPCAVNLLGDPHNCGACSNDCGGGACAEGTCAPVRVLADGLYPYAPIATDATSVYAFDATATELVRVPKFGGHTSNLAQIDPSAAGEPWSIAADSSGVYWLYGGEIWALPTGASQPTMLESELYLAQGPLRLDPGAIYFASLSPPSGIDGGAISPAVWRQSKSGGIPELVYRLQVLDVTAEGFPFAISGSRLALVDGTRLLAGTVDGGFQTQLATLSNGASAMTADDASIYFTRGQSQLTGGFQCVPPDASCPLPDWFDDGGGQKGIVIMGWDGGGLRGLPSVGLPLGLQLGHGSLWAVPAIGNEVNGSIERIDIATSTAKIFAGGGQIGGFTVDADGVYWTRDGKLLFTPLK